MARRVTRSGRAPPITVFGTAADFFERVRPINDNGRPAGAVADLINAQYIQGLYDDGNLVTGDLRVDGAGINNIPRISWLASGLWVAMRNQLRRGRQYNVTIILRRAAVQGGVQRALREAERQFGGYVPAAPRGRDAFRRALIDVMRTVNERRIAPNAEDEVDRDTLADYDGEAARPITGIILVARRRQGPQPDGGCFNQNLHPSAAQRKAGTKSHQVAKAGLILEFQKSFALNDCFRTAVARSYREYLTVNEVPNARLLERNLISQLDEAFPNMVEKGVGLNEAVQFLNGLEDLRDHWRIVFRNNVSDSQSEVVYGLGARHPKIYLLLHKVDGASTFKNKEKFVLGYHWVPILQYHKMCPKCYSVFKDNHKCDPQKLGHLARTHAGVKRGLADERATALRHSREAKKQKLAERRGCDPHLLMVGDKVELSFGKAHSKERKALRLYYDIETAPIESEGGDSHCYAVGVDYEVHCLKNGVWGTEYKYKCFWGVDAMHQFIKWLNGVGTPYWIIAYNGACFDHIILLREYFQFQEEISAQRKKHANLVKGVTNHNGKILKGCLGEHMLWDPFRFVSCTLKSATEAMCRGKVSEEDQHAVSKGSFPHEWMRSNTVEDLAEKLKYVGPVPEAKHWPGGQLPEDCPEGSEWNLEEYSKRYLRSDCACLRALSDVFLDLMYDLGHEVDSAIDINPLKFMTGPQMSFDIWRRMCDPDVEIEVPGDRKDLYEFIRESLVGGRTLCLRSRNTKEKLCYIDVNSLYPYAMLKKFPTGKHREATQEDFDAGNFEDLLGIYKVEVFVDEEVRKIIVPPIICARGHVIDGLRWGFPVPADLDPSNIRKNINVTSLNSWVGTYTSIDLDNARKLGYKFKFISGIVWESKAPVFHSYITTMYSRRKEAKRNKQDGLSLMYKILMNSLFGKQCQKWDARGSVVLGVDDTEGWNKFWEECDEDSHIIDFQHLGEHAVMIEFQRSAAAFQYEKPVHYGAFILAYSRQIMEKLFNMCDPTRRNPKAGVYYTDTDSIICSDEMMRQFIKEGLVSDELGDIKNELGENVILEGDFVGIAPKTYGFRESNRDGTYVKEELHLKGIPMKQVSPTPTFELLVKLYESGEVQKFFIPCMFRRGRMCIKINSSFRSLNGWCNNKRRYLDDESEPDCTVPMGSSWPSHKRRRLETTATTPMQVEEIESESDGDIIEEDYETVSEDECGGFGDFDGLGNLDDLGDFHEDDIVSVQYSSGSDMDDSDDSSSDSGYESY